MNNTEFMQILQTNVQMISILRSKQPPPPKMVNHLMTMGNELKKLQEEVQRLSTQKQL